ncbi:hypothetical protein PS15m_000649 [Mucor circinelloides]
MRFVYKYSSFFQMILFLFFNTNLQQKHMSNKSVHIPFLSEDEKIFLNTTATFSQARRTSHSTEQCNSVRPSMEDNTNAHQRYRRNQAVSVSSLALLWKRRDSSTSTCSSSSSSNNSAAGSVVTIDHNPSMTSHYSMDEDYQEACPKSPKARELESLIFEQPQRTVRLSLTPGCAV